MSEMTREQIEYQRQNISAGMKAQGWDAPTLTFNLLQLGTICDLALSALTARSEGFADGVEAAAKMCEGSGGDAGRIVGPKLAARIRTLTPPEPNDGGERG